MSGIMRAAADFAAKAAQSGSASTKKPATKKSVNKSGYKLSLWRSYCLRRLKALRQRSAVRSGGTYRMPFSGGSRFSLRMPRMNIRSSRAQQTDKVCETVLRGTPKTAVAER